MADEKRASYPMIPLKHWWALRRKFVESVPATVTAGYIATELQMEESSAQTNVIPYLKNFRIIDEDGKPLDRAYDWRDDEQYTGVCEEIRNELYPPELLDALPPPSPDLAQVRQWFANQARVGSNAARKMATVYRLLCAADPSKDPGVSKRPSTTRRRRRKESQQPSRGAEPVPHAPRAVRPIPALYGHPSLTIPGAPWLHIDIQIHISPDASTRQIDDIFASMAKHLSQLRESAQ